MPQPVLIPLLNPNEPEAKLAALHVHEGQSIALGDLLCTLETTKSTADVAAEADGYVAGLRCQQGETVRAGDILCYLAEEAGWTPPASPVTASRSASTPETEVPEGLRITQPALSLAQQMGLDLNQLPRDRLVTESIVRGWSPGRAGAQEQRPEPILSAPQSALDPTAIIIYGGGGHGKALIDLLRTLGTYRIVGILDDGLQAGEQVMGVPILGSEEKLPEIFAQGVRLAVNAVGGIGNLTVRVEVFQRLALAGFACPAVIHPTAFVEPSASLAAGVQIMPHAYVGSEARLGFGVIVNTGAILSHDCRLDDYVNISPGAMLAGEVKIGAGTLVGMGSTINLRVKVGAGARIGNGSTVIQDVPEKGIVRAGTTWPER